MPLHTAVHAGPAAAEATSGSRGETTRGPAPAARSQTGRVALGREWQQSRQRRPVSSWWGARGGSWRPCPVQQCSDAGLERRRPRKAVPRPRSGWLARASVPGAHPCRCHPAAPMPGAVRPVSQGQPWGTARAPQTTVHGSPELQRGRHGGQVSVPCCPAVPQLASMPTCKPALEGPGRTSTRIFTPQAPASVPSPSPHR